MPRTFSGRRVKIHRNYTVSEAADLLRAHPNTLHTWLKAGLPCIKDKRPWLILGRDLRTFLDRRRDRSRVRCPANHLYCFRCRAARQPAGLMLDCEPTTATHGNLKGLCSVCEAWMNRRASLAKLGQVAGLCIIAFPHRQQSLTERS